MTRLTKRDLQMLDLCCRMETVLVADRLGIKVSTINARFEWLREKKKENKLFLKQLKGFEDGCSSVRKRLTSNERNKKTPAEKEELVDE